MKIIVGTETLELNTSWLDKEGMEEKVIALLKEKGLIKNTKEVVFVSETSNELFHFGIQETYYFRNDQLVKKYPNLFN